MARTNLVNQFKQQASSAAWDQSCSSFTAPAGVIVASIYVVTEPNTIASANGTLSGGGLTWHLLAKLSVPSAVFGAYWATQEIWYAVNASSQTFALRWQHTAATAANDNGITFTAVCYDDRDTTSPIGTSGSYNDTTVNSNPSAISFNLAAAPATDDIVIAFCCTADMGTSNTTRTPSAGWTEIYDCLTSNGYGQQECMERTASTSQAVAWTDITDNQTQCWQVAAYAVALKKASGGGGPVANTINLAGSITPTGTLAKAITASKRGTIAPVGVAVLLVALLRSGQIAPSGALGRVISLLRGGSLTSSGAASRKTSIARGGNSTPTGATTKAVSKAVAGSITPTAALAIIRAILLSLGGAIGLSGTMGRLTRKSLSGSASSSGTLRRAIARTFVGAIASAGAAARQTRKSFSGAIASTGALTAQAIRAFFITLGGNLAPSGSLTKTVGKKLSGVTAMAGAVRKATQSHFAGLIAPSGMVRKAIARTFRGAVSLIGSLINALVGATPPLFLPTRVTVVDPTSTLDVAAPSSELVVADVRSRVFVADPTTTLDVISVSTTSDFYHG